jgi:hypothetical protein
VVYLGKRECVIRGVDIKNKLPFVRCPDDMITSNEEDKFWESIQNDRAEGVRVRALFLDQPTGPVLQMMGTKYVTYNKCISLPLKVHLLGIT